MNEAIEKLLSAAAQARREKRLVDAWPDLMQAVALARETQEPREVARAVTESGRIERDMGHVDVAHAAYQEAAAIYRERGDALKLAHTIRHIGDIYQDSGRAGAAEPCYNEALALCRAHSETPALDLANAVRPLALLKDDAGEFDDADRLWESADVLPGVAECAARLALLARRREDPERARRFLGEASTAAENKVRTWIAG